MLEKGLDHDCFGSLSFTLSKIKGITWQRHLHGCLLLQLGHLIAAERNESMEIMIVWDLLCGACKSNLFYPISLMALSTQTICVFVYRVIQTKIPYC